MSKLCPVENARCTWACGLTESCYLQKKKTAVVPWPKWYRYEAVRLDGGRLAISVQEFTVARTTPCGVHLNYGHSTKWVSNTAKKRFAYPSRELARESFLARKRRHISILTHQLHEARLYKAMVEANVEDSYDLDFDIRVRIDDQTLDA